MDKEWKAANGKPETLFFISVYVVYDCRLQNQVGVWWELAADPWNP